MKKNVSLSLILPPCHPLFTSSQDMVWILDKENTAPKNAFQMLLCKLHSIPLLDKAKYIKTSNDLPNTSSNT